MHQLKPYSKTSSKASKPKASKTLNVSDTIFKAAGNDFYRASKYINDSSQYEPSIEFDIEDQGQAQANKLNNEPVSKEIPTKKMSRHPRNFSLPEISNIHHLSSEKAPVSGTIHELAKKMPVSQSISGQDQISTYNELASSQRGSSLKNSRVLNPSLTSLHPKEEVNPQHLRALEKLIVTQGKIEKKRQLSQSQSQKGILVKRDISHLSNSASKGNVNSVIFVESQTETPKMRPERLYMGMANNSNGKVWTPDKEKENHEVTAKSRRQATSISELGRGLPSSQSLEKLLIMRNPVNANKSEVDPIASFLDKVKNENEEKSSTKREKAKVTYRTPRRNVTDLHFALSSARMQLQENIIAEENENTNGDKTEDQVNSSTITVNPSFNKLYNHNISHEKLTPSEYLLHSGKKLTGLGTATGPCVPKVWDLASTKNSQEGGIDNEEKMINLLIADLKKYVPTAMSNAPPSRQDAIGLNEWLGGKVETVIKGSEDDMQKLSKCDTLYNLAVNEIIRQVSIDCGERGETLYHIWWNYLKMFAQFKQRVHIEDEKVKEACLKESQRQQNIFNEILFRKDSEIETLKADILKLEDEKKAVREKCERAISKKTKYHNKVDDMKKLLDKTKEIVQELRAENEAYARRLNRKLGPNGKPGHVPLYLAHHRPSREDEGDSLLKSDRDTILMSERGTQEAQDIRGRMSIATKSVEKAEKKVKVEGLDTSSEDSDESSEDFAYENLRVSNRPTYMNNNVVTYRGVDKTVEDRDKSIKIFAETKEIEVQTELNLVEDKYNEVLENQKTLEEILAEHRLKQQVGDILDEAENIQEENEVQPEKSLLTKSFSWYSLSQKSLVEDRIDGIGKFSMDKKKLKKHKGSFRSLKALKSSSGQNSEQNSPSSKSNISSQMKIEGSKALLKETVLPSMRKVKSVTDGYLNPEEDKRQLHDKLLYQKTSTLQTESEMSEVVIEGSGRIPSLKIFPSIDEQEEGKSTQRSPNVEKQNTLGLKPLKPNLDDLEDGCGEIERTSDYNSLTQDAFGHASIHDGLDHCTEEDTRTLKPSRIIERDFPETPIRRKIPSFSRDLITDSGPVTPKSYNTDDLFQNLEDSDSDDEIDEIENERHESMAIIEEAAEEDKGSPMRDYSRKRVISPQGETHKEIRVEPVATEQNDMPKLSMATIVKLKLKASRVINTMRKEEASPMVDKAKLMTVTRMYKVEKEKNSLLQKTISELEEQLINEKKAVSTGEETISDLKLHIKLLEDLKERCPHGKCEACVEEHAAEMKAEQEECFTMGQDTLNMFYSNGGSKMSESEIDGSEAGKAESRVKRLKKKLKSQQSEFGKKKEKEQKEKFIVSVIEKVKEKKLAKFKNFTQLSGVLKQITCLYNDRIAQGKENVSLKDESFAVYVYNWFIGNFGLRKIAEQKFVSFALSIKKHIHVVRVNMFARFLGLLEGPVNYSLDETNKYLECLDFINNSSLGTTIVNQETDTKHYAPFLRALDYIKHFAEDKMPLEEYTEFRQEFEALKETDPKNLNKNGIVDIDLFMAKILTKYRIISNRTKQFVVNAFKAGDLDNNKYCSLKEFVMIYRYIEPQKFDISSAENLFNEKSDTKIEGQLSLSFDKFTIVCVEYGLFRDSQQDLFLGLEAHSLEDQVKMLQDTWVNTYDRLNRKIKGLEQASQEEKQYWLNVLENVHDKIFKAYEMSLEDLKPVLMAYKMMDLEVERLKQLEVKHE